MRMGDAKLRRICSFIAALYLISWIPIRYFKFTNSLYCRKVIRIRLFCVAFSKVGVVNKNRYLLRNGDCSSQGIVVVF